MANGCKANLALDDNGMLAGAYVDESGHMDFEISGLREVAPGVFRLHGVKEAQIKWELLAEALGRKGPIPKEMATQIADLANRQALVEALADRMKRVG